MSVGEATGLIVAVTGVLGLILAHRLGLLGQRKDAQAQAAATRLQERVAAFDELESLNDRLGTENARLRELLVEAEATGNLRLARQAQRCRAALDETTAALASLQAVVLAEVSQATASHSINRAQQHIADDHPDLDDD